MGGGNTREGSATPSSTVLSLLALALLLSLGAPFAWPASLVPVVATAMFWAASRLLLRLGSTRAVNPFGVGVE